MIFWTLSHKNSHFWSKNCQKMVFYGKKLLIFLGQHMGPSLMSTQIIWLGLHCKIDEVKVNLLPFIFWRKFSSFFSKKLVRSEFFIFEAVHSFYFFLDINAMKKNYNVLIQRLFQVTGVFSKLTYFFHEFPGKS